MPRLTVSQIEQLSGTIAETLHAVQRGELDASAAMRHRLEGAWIALEAVRGRPGSVESVPLKTNDRLL